ncbi:sigma-70 family RNA polymerase sigma factor [Vibrio fluvialis]|uniref:sigma-70 family RNA polymerase sigma factor n=1 Tax=Vibrio fluvialis TaxID=676 RepID=UPI001559EF8E|nr:sigma-70 family RNA polymerase sigma factor [Vibrio fluvialis]EKO5121171.1 sigma-70 family RNA polymerase sigma factor [Vibrio fluvialis]
MNTNGAVPCLLTTWSRSEQMLFRWLVKRCGDRDLAVDVLQETFLKALQMNQSFCEIEHQKAWLFRVAANVLTDEWRRHQRDDELCDAAIPTLTANTDEPEAVDGLTQCLPTALERLSEDDREIIQACDLNGLSQQAFAEQKQLPLSTVKSRIQRARAKLRDQLKTHCHIRFDDNHKICCFTPSSLK